MLNDDLEYFLAIASSGTFTLTAERLGISQPALTKAIQRLERKVGVKLMIRSPRGTELTEAGRAFYARVQGMSRNMEDAVQEARHLGGGQAGLLRIGVTPATTDFTVRALLPTLTTERPVAHISFCTAVSGALLEILVRRDVELAVCPVPESLPAGLECDALYTDPCSLIMNDSHPLATQAAIAVEELVNYEWAGTRKHEFTRSQLEAAFSRRGLRRPRMVVEADTLAALTLIVSRTQLISMINVRSLRPGSLPDNVVVRPFSLEGMQRRIGVIRRAGYLSPIAERAHEILRDAAAAP